MSNGAGQLYVLVGPHKGKTMTVNGHEFVDGEFMYYGNPEQITVLTRVFSNYAALPVDAAELQALRLAVTQQAAAAPVVQQAAAVVEEAPAAASEADELAMMLGADPAATEGSGNPVPELPTLAEAVGQLDPEVDAHWTSNNLPSIDFLTTLTGKKPTRGEVEGVAEGYTRAKARSARAA